jgi:uncharacterized membrane protein YcaP (DUF421 family)
MLVVFLRVLILFVIVVVVMRLMGKRQIGQLQPFELAVAIMVSELAAVPMQNTGIPLINGIIPILTLLAAQIFLSFLSIKSIVARKIICGKPDILIYKGKIMEENLRNEMYTVNDLMEQLRINNCPNLGDIEQAVLETNGQLSIMLKAQKRPIQPEDMGIDVEKETAPIILITDGRFIKEGSRFSGLSQSDILKELKKKGIHSVKDVFYGGLDSKKKFVLQKYSESIEPTSSESNGG